MEVVAERYESAVIWLTIALGGLYGILLKLRYDMFRKWKENKRVLADAWAHAHLAREAGYSTTSVIASSGAAPSISHTGGSPRTLR